MVAEDDKAKRRRAIEEHVRRTHQEFEELAPEPLLIDEIGWPVFLRIWNDLAKSLYMRVSELSRKFGSGDAESDAVHANGGMGFPPATDVGISATEARLGVTLPSSYKGFLYASNGWTFYTLLDHVENIGWLHEKDPFEIEAWHYSDSPHVTDEDYFQYDLNKQEPVLIRTEYLLRSLKIDDASYSPSVTSERTLLLNPAIRTRTGEWEAWDLAPSLAGARRFRSFQEMMQHYCRQHVVSLKRRIQRLEAKLMKPP